MDLTLRDLKSVLRYDPRTGRWFNRVWRGGTARAGLQTGRPNSDGYIQICVKCRRYMSSRLAYFYMKGKWPPQEMDHKNLDHSDDRWSNLRPATDSQNQMNRRLQRNNKSGHRGVGKRGSHWYANIRVNKQRIRLGKHTSKRAAIAARRKAEEQFFGEFAR